MTDMNSEMTDFKQEVHVIFIQVYCRIQDCTH
jgi:hypothetical protein